MKVNEAITKVDDLEPNTYEDNEKLDWLTELDKRIAIEILNVREREEDVVVELIQKLIWIKNFLCLPHMTIYMSSGL